MLWLPGRRRARRLVARAGARATADDAAALRHWVPDLADRDVYVCGPEPWARDVRRSAEAAGVPRDRIHVETFGW